MKKIAILGSTGSIGTQTLDVIRAHSDELEVVALAAGSNKERLKEQIREFHPELVSLSDEKKAQELKEELAGEAVEVVCGMDGLIEVAGIDSAGSRRHHQAPAADDGGYQGGQGHCPCKQRDIGNSRSSDHSDGKGIRCIYSSGGQ